MSIHHPSFGKLDDNRVVHFDAQGKFVKQWGKLGVGPDEYIPGHVVNRYLHAYAAEFGIAGLIRPKCPRGRWTISASSAA